MKRILYYASIAVTIITTSTYASKPFTISHDSSSTKPDGPKPPSLQPKGSAQRTILFDDSLVTRGSVLDLAWSPSSPSSDTDSRGSPRSNLEREDPREDVRRRGRLGGKQPSTDPLEAFRLKDPQQSSSPPLRSTPSRSPSLSPISTSSGSILDSPLAEEVLDSTPRKGDMSGALTSESLEGSTIDLSFYDSLFNIIETYDGTFIPALNAEAFSKYISDTNVLGVLADKHSKADLRFRVIDKMLDTVGQGPSSSARKSIREAVDKWIDSAYSLQRANLVRVRLLKGVSKSPDDLKVMSNKFRDDPFSVDHHRIDSCAYVEIHKYIALFLKKLIVHLRDEKARFEALIKEHGLPPKSNFASFKDFMMRDILLLWDFLDSTSFDSTLAQMFHRTHPDLFALDFRLIIIKLMANFDFPANFRATKLEVTRVARKKGFKTFGDFIKSQKRSEYSFWTLHFGTDAMHAGGNFFFLARSEFIKNVGESFIDAFVTPFYAQEVRMQQFIIPLIDSPIIAFYTNKFLFNLIYRASRERAAHFLASMLEDWMTPKTKLYDLVTEYTELALEPSEKISTSDFREGLESILTRIKGYMPRAYMKVGRRTSTSSNSSEEGVLSQRGIQAPSSSSSSSSSTGPSSSTRISLSSTRIPTPFQGYYHEQAHYGNFTTSSPSSTQSPFILQHKSRDDNKESS